jgi:hypothetical protein
MLVVELAAQIDSISQGTHFLWGLDGQITLDWLVLAQEIEDPDILGQIANAWNNFIETGQVWALLIGLVIGYMFRSFTTF